MEPTDIFVKFLVPLAEYKSADELEKAVLAALQEQFEGDFEPGEQEHFWIRFEFPNLAVTVLNYDEFETQMMQIIKRFLSNQPSMWQVNDAALNGYGGGAWIDFWMGPADLMSIIH